MKALLVIMLKVLCTPLLAIAGWMYILTALIMWDAQFMELDEGIKKLWHRKYPA